MEKDYFVVGGHHRSFDFDHVEPENFTIFGPFVSYDDAYDVWKAQSWLNVDDALYRLEVVQEEGDED